MIVISMVQEIITYGITFTQVVPGPVQPYSAESCSQTPFIHQPRLSPAQYSLRVQICGLKHHSFHFISILGRENKGFEIHNIIIIKPIVQITYSFLCSQFIPQILCKLSYCTTGLSIIHFHSLCLIQLPIKHCKIPASQDVTYYSISVSGESQCYEEKKC